MKAPVQVEIGGQRFSVTSDDDEQHLHLVAAIVDEQIRRIAAVDNSIPLYTRAVLAALNIASEWQKLRQSQEEVERAIERLNGLLDGAASNPDGEEISERA